MRQIKRRRTRALRPRQLQCENLETRCLLAGDLSLQLLTNHYDVPSASEAVGIASGDNVRWTYRVTNNGSSTFARHEVFIKDDNGTPGLLGDDFDTTNGAIYLEDSTDAAGDNLLSPGETWDFTAWGISLDLNQNVIEAEDMSRSNFGVRSGSNASGGQLAALPDPGDSGSLSTSFHGPSGTYNFRLFVQDETDGQSSIDVKIGGSTVGSFQLDRDTDGGGSDDGDFSEFVLNNVAINTGDELRLDASGDGIEFVRTDLLILDRVGDDGVYTNTAMLTAGPNTDSDVSHYTKPNPGIDLEKFTNAQDADTRATAVRLSPGSPLTWLYRVTNTGNVLHPISDVYVKDDNGTDSDSSDDFDSNGLIQLFANAETADGVLAPGETIVYYRDSVAQDLTIVDTYSLEAENINNSGFDVVSSTGASGNQILKLASRAGTGEIWTSFGGDSGVYDIKVFVQDETDGVSQIDVLVDGTDVGTILLDRDSDGPGDHDGPFSEFVLDGIRIDSADDVRLVVAGDSTELVRVDRLEIVGGGTLSVGPNLIVNGSFVNSIRLYK